MKRLSLCLRFLMKKKEMPGETTFRGSGGSSIFDVFEEQASILRDLERSKLALSEYQDFNCQDVYNIFSKNAGGIRYGAFKHGLRDLGVEIKKPNVYLLFKSLTNNSKTMSFIDIENLFLCNAREP